MTTEINNNNLGVSYSRKNSERYISTKEIVLTQLMQRYQQARWEQKEDLTEVRRLFNLLREKGDEATAKQKLQYQHALDSLAASRRRTSHAHMELIEGLTRGVFDSPNSERRGVKPSLPQTEMATSS